MAPHIGEKIDQLKWANFYLAYNVIITYENRECCREVRMKDIPVEVKIAVVGPGEWAGIPHSLWFAVQRNGKIVAICEQRQDAAKVADVPLPLRRRTAA